jgi:hypothetical protein
MHVRDPTMAIGEAIALSRFVLDNAHSFEFVGRVIDRSDGHRQIASNLGFDGRVAFRTRKDRFWLTMREAEELRDLLDQYRVVKESFRIGCGVRALQADVLDHPYEFVELVALLSREADELFGSCDDGTLFRSAGDGDASPAPELEQSFVAELPQGAEDGVGVDPEHGGEVFRRR